MSANPDRTHAEKEPKMMIDHVAAAMTVANDVAARDDLTPEAEASLAVARAMTALAVEQRVANLISAVSSCEFPGHHEKAEGIIGAYLGSIRGVTKPEK